MIAIALTRLGGGVGDVTGLRLCCALEPVSGRAGHGHAAVICVHGDAVDPAVEPLDQLVAEQRIAGLVIKRVNAAERVGNKALADDLDIIGMERRFRGQRGDGKKRQTKNGSQKPPEQIAHADAPFRIRNHSNCNRL